MARKQRGSRAAADLQTKMPCAVCGLRDARALVDVELTGGVRTVLCGTHDLMLRRSGSNVRSVDEVKALLLDRRRDDRRAHGYEEVDELAASLAAAFTRERRGTERRAI